jgi:hypothetical protein
MPKGPRGEKPLTIEQLTAKHAALLRAAQLAPKKAKPDA